MSNRMCCVVNCCNSYKNTTNVNFYSFPNRPHEKELKVQWTKAVKRLEKNGQLWQPKSHSLICSDHFVGSQKSSKDPNSPSYVPSLFPQVYKNKSINEEQSITRYKRNLKRHEVKLKNVPVNSTLNISMENTENHSEPFVCTKLNYAHVACQAGFDYLHKDLFKFECVFNKLNNDVSTQASIPLDYNNTFKKPNTSDISCGPDTSSINLNYESQLKDLTGTTFKVFKLLLSLMVDLTCSTISKENRLLIFLMKIKLGITYSAIGVFFNINRTTVARIFYSILNSLTTKTKEFIFWPNKKTILETLSKSFKKNFPNRRCITDCTEIKTEQPNTVEQRVNMYSRYKNV